MDDDIGINPEIAATMGFGSFGAQPQNKRRKFTHNAVVEGQSDVSNKSAKPSGSGANTTMLGVRSKPPHISSAEPLQIDGNGTTQDVDSAAVNEESKIKEKAKIKAKGKKGGAPLGLADYVAWGNKITPQTVPQAPQINTESAVSSAEPASKPAAEPHVNNATTTQNGGAGAKSWPQGMPDQQELAALRRGIKNARGDMAYFLPSFIEDPWNGLAG
ncbi:hypothetical protein BDV97DRAFT_365001 [Delphinella strobiligena]|nr:hypothetical protein BDV97DRAFT_365001 [Delphinella strobiligena]